MNQPKPRTDVIQFYETHPINEAQILHASVRAQKHSLLGELRPDRSRGVQARSAVGKFEL